MLTDEHEHAMKVWREAYGAYVATSIKAAAAVIAADRAGLVAEVERLVRAWEAQHKEKVKERGESRLWFERAQKWAEENARLREALFEIVGPLNVCSDNPNVPDDTLIAVDITMGEIRKARSALKDTRNDADA